MIKIISPSYKASGMFLIVSLLLITIAAIVLNLTSTPPRPPVEVNLIDTNQLYLQAVQAEQSSVATVNNQPITADEFNKLYLVPTRYASSVVTIKDVKKALVQKREIVNKLIIEKLVEQEAIKRDITASEQEIDTSIAALIKTFPNQDKYNHHIAQLPSGEDYLRRAAKSNILKGKLAMHETVRGDAAGNVAQKAPGPTNKKKVTKSQPSNAGAVLIQRLKVKAEIVNLIDGRHMILLRQTGIVSVTRSRKGAENVNFSSTKYIAEKPTGSLGDISSDPHRKSTLASSLKAPRGIQGSTDFKVNLDDN